MQPSSLAKHLRYASRAAVRDNYLNRRILGGLKETASYDSEKLSTFQSNQLYRTLRCALSNLPFYAHLKKDFHPSEAPQVLREYFHVITKQTLLDHRGELYPNRGRLHPWEPIGTTSGTTGQPLTVLRTLRSVLMEQAFLKRFWLRSGYEEGARKAFLRGDLIVPPAQTTPPFWFLNPYNSQLVISVRHLNDECVGPIIDELERFAPSMLQAYPSAVFALARYLASRNRRLHIPIVFTSSEVLYAHQRSAIETWLGAKVYDMYGMAERVALGTECAHGSLHLNTDYSFVEILDDEGNLTDDYGSVVGTTFFNFRMPLVRYMVNDRTRWKSGSCSCGSVFPMIEQVSGRIADRIFGSRGQIVSPGTLATVFRSLPHIQKSQVAQVGPGEWQVRIVPTASYRLSDSESLIRSLHDMVDPDVRISVVLKPELPNAASGKFRWIVNETPREAEVAPSEELTPEPAYAETR